MRCSSPLFRQFPLSLSLANVNLKIVIIAISIIHMEILAPIITMYIAQAWIKNSPDPIFFISSTWFSSKFKRKISHRDPFYPRKSNYFDRVNEQDLFPFALFPRNGECRPLSDKLIIVSANLVEMRTLCYTQEFHWRIRLSQSRITVKPWHRWIDEEAGNTSIVSPRRLTGTCFNFRAASRSRD